jgi:hypothetical protein
MGKRRNTYRILVGKHMKICCEMQALMGGNIKIHLKGRGFNSDYWINLAQMETIGGLLRTRQWIFGFHNIQKKSQPA